MTSTTNPDFSEHLNNFYNNNPFVQLLGIQLKKIQFGQVTLSMKAQNQLSNFYHITHGGALASLADTTMGATCLSVNKLFIMDAKPWSAKQRLWTIKDRYVARPQPISSSLDLTQAKKIFCGHKSRYEYLYNDFVYKNHCSRS